jgi:pyridoxal phosphate enzyme (YggS family)
VAGLTAEAVGENLAVIRERIEKAGRDPDRIEIVAVTKGFGLDAVEAALANGLFELGENRAPELLHKAEASPPDVHWHYLGNVQRNKVAKLAEHVDLWQAVDRVAAGEEIATRAPGAHVLIQVNISGEPQKHGCTPADARHLFSDLTRLGLEVEGLMGVGPTGPPEASREAFDLLEGLKNELELHVVSMGMSDDLELAVQKGSNMLRIGRGLFGERVSTT